MQTLPGKHPNSFRYFLNGFMYYRDSENHLKFRCALRDQMSCSAYIYVQSTNNLENQQIQVTNNHTHEPDNNLYLREKFEIDVKERARERADVDEPKQVFDFVLALEEYAGLREDIRVDYYPRFKQKIMRVFNDTLPGTPHNLEELHEMLLSYRRLGNLYRGIARAIDGSISLVFMDDTAMEALNRCSQLLSDGTFTIIPRDLGISQVYIISFRKLDTGFASIICFCSSRTEFMYDAMWDKIFELIPGLSDRIKSFICDFEKGQSKSVKKKFPNAIVTGCSFHAKQNMGKRWERLNINVQHEHILETAYALVHLPADRIAEGAAYLTELIDLAAGSPDAQKLQEFGAYVRTTWVPLANHVSVYKQPVKTNNISENINLHAQKMFGKHPNIWKMLCKLRSYTLTVAINIRKVERGQRVNPARPQNLIAADIQIKLAEDKLETNRYDLQDFLLTISALRNVHMARVIIHNQLQATNGDFEEAIPIDVGIQDIPELQQDLAIQAGAGEDFENLYVRRRRRREHVGRDQQLMPGPMIEAPPRNRQRRRTVNQQNPQQQQAAAEPVDEPVAVRRGPGRPPGSRNRNNRRAQAQRPTMDDYMQANADDPFYDQLDAYFDYVLGEPLPSVAEQDRVDQPAVVNEGELLHNVVEEDQPPPNEPPRKKKKKRAGKNSTCYVCCSTKQVQKLRPCGHRVCSPCAEELDFQNCPYCTQPFDSYLPEHLMGGERFSRPSNVIEID